VYDVIADRVTLGRSKDNDFCLPDPQRFLSGKHCLIEQRDGQFFLTDTSTNGVFFNGSDERMERGSSEPITAGDRFRLGDYEFEVEAYGSQPDEEPAAAEGDLDEFTFSGGVNPFEDDSPDAVDDPLMGDQADLNTPLSQMDDSLLGDGVSLDNLWDLDDSSDEPDEFEAVPLEESSPLQQHWSPPKAREPSAPQEPATPPPAESAPVDSPADLPADFMDWDSTGTFSPDMLQQPPPEQPAPPPAPEPPPQPPPAPKAQQPAPPQPPPAAPVYSSSTPSPAPAASSGSPAGSDLQSFATGAGISHLLPATLDADAFFQTLGKIMRVIVDGMMQSLSSRSHIKSEFRLDQTMIRPTENNPLKFSVSPEEAMTRMLFKADQAYMTGSEAIENGFEDINAHQLAVMAGTEAALNRILERFDPSNLEQKLGEHTLLDNIIPGSRKARYWDVFKLLYSEIKNEAEDDFQQLFGTEFARAYEEQLDRMKRS
jgi:type VI secretion system protein